MNLNERPVPVSTETGFTGPKADWFDGKFFSPLFLVVAKTFAYLRFDCLWQMLSTVDRCLTTSRTETSMITTLAPTLPSIFMKRCSKTPSERALTKEPSWIMVPILKTKSSSILELVQEFYLFLQLEQELSTSMLLSSPRSQPLPGKLSRRIICKIRSQ